MIILWIGMLIRTFFGWNPNEPKLQETENWFIQDMTNTWNTTWLDSNINTGDTNTETNKQDKGYIEIKVMMPKYFYNLWWKNFAEDMYNNQKVYMNFSFIDDLNSYRNIISNENFSEADLFLFPYDRINKTPTRFFSPNGTESYFDQFIQPILNSSKISFMPFAADPMVMYTVSWQLLQNDFSAIHNFVYDRKNSVPLSFPLFFGIVSDDFYDNWFKREYQDIVRYALMHYFTTYRDIHSLDSRINSNEIEKYNTSNLNKIQEAITTPGCQYFPSLCFQIYKFVWLRFGFLSDADIVNTYFTWKKSYFDNLSRTRLPYSELESPVRIRWRWMPSSLEDKESIKWVNTFFARYTKNHSEYDLRSSTLSVFSWDNWSWIIYNNYIWLRWYLLTEWWDYIDMSKENKEFWDLINYKISAEEYIR